MLDHYETRSTRSSPGKGRENGVVEKAHDTLKSAVRQALIARGSRDFGDADAYQAFIAEFVERLNRGREAGLAAERSCMSPLPQNAAAELHPGQRGSRVHERRSVIVTTNLVFSEWGRIFKNPMTTAAAVVWLVHHAVILEFAPMGTFRAPPEASPTLSAPAAPSASAEVAAGAEAPLAADDNCAVDDNYAASSDPRLHVGAPSPSRHGSHAARNSRAAAHEALRHQAHSLLLLTNQPLSDHP